MTIAEAAKLAQELEACETFSFGTVLLPASLQSKLLAALRAVPQDQGSAGRLVVVVGEFQDGWKYKYGAAGNVWSPENFATSKDAEDSALLNDKFISALDKDSAGQARQSDHTPRRVSADGAAAGAVDSAPAPGAVDDWFRVEVSDHDGQVVAIETEMLAGRDIGEKEDAVIRKAIAHLSGFIGAPDTPSAESVAAGLKFATRREEDYANEIGKLRNVIQSAFNGADVREAWNRIMDGVLTASPLPPEGATGAVRDRVDQVAQEIKDLFARYGAQGDAPNQDCIEVIDLTLDSLLFDLASPEHAAEFAPLPPEGRSAWQPIETAPQNHLPILIHGPYGIVVAFRDINWTWWPCPATKRLPYVPTEWQPLPAAPDAGKADEGSTWPKVHIPGWHD